ncbi:MAG: AtpZ/AtpI family protein [Patescibacteria group bacterium]|nr:AtpZ/AtpI family protein [Patescibacteria group bacterium]
MPEENDKNQALSANGKRPVAWWQPAITMFLKLSVWIAAPVIVALYCGAWLDKKFNSAPWLFLTCIGAAFALSLFGLLRITAKELKKLEKK